jgi:hypothetical protein
MQHHFEANHLLAHDADPHRSIARSESMDPPKSTSIPFQNTLWFEAEIRRF